MQSEPRNARIPVWALPRSLAATDGIDVSFSSSGYLDVSVPRVPLRTLWIHVRMTVVRTAGFPHSDISGSMDMCSSPKLFAAYHVFHRLSVPRHPPCALFCLTSLIPCLSFLPKGKGGLPPCRPSVSGGRLHVDTCFFMVRVSPNLNLPLFWENLHVFFTENIQNSLMSFSLGIIKKTFTMCSFQGTDFVSHLRSFSIKKKKPGSLLLSHAVPSIVPSAVWALTIVFGMGTGVSPRRIATRYI